MESKIKLREGEVFDILVKRLNKDKSEIAIELNISVQTLSKAFASEILTRNIRQRAAILLGVPESFFNGWYVPNLKDDDIGIVEEPRLEYQRAGQVGELTADQVLKYLEEKDKWFEEERVRTWPDCRMASSARESRKPADQVEMMMSAGPILSSMTVIMWMRENWPLVSPTMRPPGVYSRRASSAFWWGSFLRVGLVGCGVVE